MENDIQNLTGQNNVGMRTRLTLIFLITVNGALFAQKDRLDYYLAFAKTSSPILFDLRNQVASSMYDSLLIRATYKPQVSGSSTNTFSPIIGGWGYDAVLTNKVNFNTLVGVNKQLMNTKVVNAQFQTIALQNRSLDNTARITEQDITRAVTAQYIMAYGDQLQLKFIQEIKSLLNGEEVILKELTRKNVYKQVDYLAFLVTLQQQDLLLKQQDIQFMYDYAGLAYLCGIEDTTRTELKSPDLSTLPIPDLYHSVFFKQFELDSLKLRNNRTLVDMSYKPRINLYANAGYMSSFIMDPYKNFGTSFGISALIPIYDGKQKNMQYSKIAVAERTRQNNRAFFSNQYNQQLNQLRQQLGATEALIENIRGQLKYTQSLIEVNGKLLEVGEARITDYILALNNYIQVKNLVTQNMITRLQIINQINYWNR